MNDDHLIASRSLATRLADADEAYIRDGYVPLADVAQRARRRSPRPASCSARPGTEGNEPGPRRHRALAPQAHRHFGAIRALSLHPHRAATGVRQETRAYRDFPATPLQPRRLPATADTRFATNLRRLPSLIALLAGARARGQPRAMAERRRPRDRWPWLAL
jgi:hypothetical protein